MKTKLARFKKYLADHKAPIAYSAGVVCGAVPTAYLLANRFAGQNWIEIVVDESPEQIKMMLENSGALRFDSPYTKQTVIVASRAAEAKLTQ